jgi:hypothetical protein
VLGFNPPCSNFEFNAFLECREIRAFYKNSMYKQGIWGAAVLGLWLLVYLVVHYLNN